MLVEKIVPINIMFLEEKFDSLLAKGNIKNVGGMFEVDLGAMGINKLLASGKPSRKYRIKVTYASENAAEKIKAAGGEVVAEAVEEKEDSKEEKK